MRKIPVGFKGLRKPLRGTPGALSQAFPPDTDANLPQIISVGSQGENKPTTGTHTVVYPDGIVAGDLILLVVSSEGSGAFTATGWTVLLNTSNFDAFYRTAVGGESGTTFSYSVTDTTHPHGLFVHVVRRVASGSVPEVTSANDRNGPAISPTWGAASPSLFLSFYNDQGGAPAANVTAWPENLPYHRYTLRHPNSGGDELSVSTAVTWETVATFDPNPITLSETNVQRSITIAIRGLGVNPVSPAFTNAQTFFAHKIQARIFPALLTNASTFFSPTIVSGNSVQPAKHTNAQTFFTHKILATYKPGFLANSQSFFTQTVKAPLKPTLYANAQSFFTHQIKTTIKPAFFTDADTFYGPTIIGLGVTIQPAKHFNSQRFFLTLVAGPPGPFVGLSNMYVKGFSTHRKRLIPVDPPKGYLLPPPGNLPEAAKIQRVRAYGLPKDGLKRRTVLVNQEPPGGTSVDSAELDMILVALLLLQNEGEND